MKNRRKTARLRITRRALAIGCLTALSLIAGGTLAAQEEADEERTTERVARGRISYRLYCRSCHGAAARGDGPVAEMLKVPPADLTRISARAGSFSHERIAKIIDGRGPVRGHGSSDMPIWGNAFKVAEETQDEQVVQEKIVAVVYYLKSIQIKGR